MQKLPRWVRSCRETRAGDYRQVPEQVSHTQPKRSLLICNLYLLGLQFIPQETRRQPRSLPGTQFQVGLHIPRALGKDHWAPLGRDTSQTPPALPQSFWHNCGNADGDDVYGKVLLLGHSHPCSLQFLHSCTDPQSVWHTWQRTLKHTYGCGENNDLHLFCFIYIHILNFNTKEKKLESDKCLQTRYLQIDFTQFSLVQSKWQIVLFVIFKATESVVHDHSAQLLCKLVFIYHEW